MTEVSSVGVVGGGLMGAGIAEACTRCGLDVLVVEVSSERAAAARQRVSESLKRGVERGKLTASEMQDALERLDVSEDVAALGGSDLIIEAAVEDRDLKRQIFATLDEVALPEAVLASNTSSIPIVELATATARPENVVGLHFFNPVPVMGLVEVIPSLFTSTAIVARAVAFAEGLGKTVVRAPDRAGFIVNALLIPYALDAIRMFEAGHASAADIDAAMQLGAAHPMGPLSLCDLIGNDTVLAVAESLHEEFREARYAPPALLRRMVSAGRFGRKSGEGFFRY